jgi:ankyrin repeat protein
MMVIGLQKNVCDIDGRNALHRAAMNGRLLAVSFLLGIAADPNSKDRWGHTALDLALLHDNLYHRYRSVVSEMFEFRLQKKQSPNPFLCYSFSFLI